MEFFQGFENPEFWVGLLKIIWINILLSGDNAVVIALAARGLPPDQQRKAILFGSGAAVVLRIGLTIIAAWLMALQGLQIVGGLLLLWIGAQLLADEEESDADSKEQANLMSAVRTILIADVVMSLDNVIGVAAAAKGDQSLLIIGLAISIPLVVFGSSMMIKLMERYPAIITFGAALIGWVGGETIASDVMLKDFVADNGWFHYACSLAGAAIVILWGRQMNAKAETQEDPAA
ncbi:MAG: TerC family protein [Betaproteobacteria bacterium]|jgi:YjbE family integral membrane protein|nr:TerC family protein [Betaproteobacteria bacterium]